MDSLRQYILSVTAASLVCAMAGRLLPKSGTAASIGKMVMGIFLALTVISPWAKLQLTQLEDLQLTVRADADAAVADGNSRTNLALQDIIKSQTEAYILDKAQQLNLALTVQVELTGEHIPVPTAVRLQGDASPYAKSRLQAIIVQDLGIAKENQLWT